MDITLDTDVTSWQSVNSLTGIAVGTEIQVQNKSSQEVLIITADSQPTDSSEAGAIMTPMTHNYAIVTIDSGESTVWVRPSMYGREVTLYIEDLS